MRHCSLFIVHCLLFIFPATLLAQPAAVEPPVAGRPARFSNVSGDYRIEVRAEPTDVAVEDPIRVRVIIQGTGPANYRPERKQLKLFPDNWDFHVEPVPDEDHVQPDQGIWEFAYRLRPRNMDVKAIDGIKLVVYRPRTGSYATVYAEGIPITVKARPAAVVPENLPVRTAPASFYELPSGTLQEPAGLSPPAWLLSVMLVPLFLVPPFVVIAAVRASRIKSRGRWQPQRSLAARRALDSLQSDGETVRTVLARYFQERLDCPAVEPTPGEVRRFLRKRGASRATADKLAALLATCDAERFAGPTKNANGPQREEVVRLVHTLEDDLCVR